MQYCHTFINMQPTLAEKSYRHIRNKLTNGDLVPGDRLVTRGLADEIGVSLGPVREALNRLASEGLIEHIPGAGASVRKADRQDLEELYVLRDATESCAAAEAAKFITDEQLAELETIVDDWAAIAAKIRRSTKQRATAAQFHRWLDNEEHFHEVLIEASRNRLLTKVVREYRTISRIFEAQRHAPELLTPAVADGTCRSHRNLVDALRNRDAMRSRLLMSEQIQNGRKLVLRLLRRNRGN